ncbi:MAG TPA: ATP-binding protein [Desulfobacterales bacterium]
MTFNPGTQGEKISLNLAIVGGGRACRFFLDLLQKEPLPYLDIHIVGVCDIDPEAEGFRLAKQLGLYTTDHFADFFEIENLDGIVELTNSRQVLLELIEQRPKGVGVIEHNIGRLLRSFFLTEQKLKSVEQQLLLERMSSDFLIQHSDAAIVVLNTDFTIAEANEAYLKQVGRSKEQVLGDYCYRISRGLDVPCPSAQPGQRCPMVETMRTGKSAHVIHELPGSGFEARYGNIVTYPLKDPDDRIVRIIEIWRDISEEIASRWETRYQKLKLELGRLIQEDRMISLGKLVASCVHEINNPIQGLMTFTALMQSMVSGGNLSSEEVDEFRQYLALMAEELERCGNIVSGLLSFSRESPLQYREVDVNELLESILTLSHHKMELQKVELQTQLSDQILLISGDTNRLQQCLLNLVFNAMESMPSGGKLTLSTGLDPSGGKVVIKVIDTGCGIASEHLDHIFDPFYTTKAEGQGTGLGLSIVYGVVKVHRGDIQVDSRPGEGTRFVLTFPRMAEPTEEREGLK